jgi:biopolymer transport protein ExbB
MLGNFRSRNETSMVTRFFRLAAKIPRWWVLGLVCLMAGAAPLALDIGFLSSGPAPVWAQEAEEGLMDDEPRDTRGTESPSPSRAAAAAAVNEQRTVLQSLLESGFVGLLIFLLSMVAVGFIVEHSLTIRKGVMMPDETVDALDTLLEEGRVDEALEMCRDQNNTSLFSNVVLAGLERFKSSEFGFAEYRAAVEEAGEEQTARLYRKTEVLGVIGAIAPMLGLLGTVIGMIKAFNVIASTGGMARPDQLAGGISQALVTTLMGLVVAIPTMVAFSFFRNKIDSIVAEAGSRVEQILAPLGRRR